MGLFVCYIGLLTLDILIKVSGFAISAKLRDKDTSSEYKEFLLPKVLENLGKHHGTNQKKAKVPQYMLDLFAFVTDNETGRRRADISLPGNIVRSFYSELPSTNNNLPAMLTFNITGIPSTEVIRKCELHIYRKKSRHLLKEERNQPHFHMIQIRSPGLVKSTDEKLLSSKGRGWVKFDVTSAAKLEISSRFLMKDVLLKLSVLQIQSKQKEDKLEFALNENDKNEPILVMYTDDKISPNAVVSEKRTADMNLQEYLTKGKGNGSKRRVKRSVKRSVNCHRENMMVDVKKIGWKEIIQPALFNAYRCSGKCSAFASGNKTNHALIQATISELKPAGIRVEPPCCTPWDFESKEFLVLENPKVVRLQTFSNIVVKSCGCL